MKAFLIAILFALTSTSVRAQDPSSFSKLINVCRGVTHVTTNVVIKRDNSFVVVDPETAKSVYVKIGLRQWVEIFFGGKTTITGSYKDGRHKKIEVNREDLINPSDLKKIEVRQREVTLSNYLKAYNTEVRKTMEMVQEGLWDVNARLPNNPVGNWKAEDFKKLLETFQAALDLVSSLLETLSSSESDLEWEDIPNGMIVQRIYFYSPEKFVPIHKEIEDFIQSIIDTSEAINKARYLTTNFLSEDDWQQWKNIEKDLGSKLLSLNASLDNLLESKNVQIHPH